MSKYSIDNLIKIGSSHILCEDYSLTGLIPSFRECDDVPYIIVSDGCSSSEFTDIGSRILCLSANKVLHSMLFNLPDITPEIFGEKVISTSEPIARSMGLGLECLDATLIVAFVVNGKLRCFAYGDGCIILGTKGTNSTRFFNISYETNAPFYLTYSASSKKKEGYFEKFGDGKKKTEYQCLFPTFNQHNDKIDQKEIITNPVTEPFVYYGEFFKDDYILVMTDGIEQFMTPNGVKKTVVDVVEELTSFKSYAGEFVKRRTGRVLKDLKIQGFENVDDFSIAGIYTEEE